MRAQRRWVPLPVVLALLSLIIVVQPVYAQTAPNAPVPLPGFGELVSDPGKWLTTTFNAALVNLGKQTTHDAVDFMTWMLGSGNVISQTPAGLSYDSDAVKGLWRGMRNVANAGLAVVTVWGGVNLMTRATPTRPAATMRHACALPLARESNSCLPILQPSGAGRYTSCPGDASPG